MRLADVLPISRIKIPLESTDRDQAIKELINLMKDSVNDLDLAYKAVLDREKIMTTGVGNGIAIPHCKHHTCPNFAVALGITNQEIEFNSIDNKKVKLVFLLLGPEKDPGIHIKLLSRISRLMTNDDFRKKLISCTDNKEVYQLIENEEASFPEIE
jgi:fructose PTS system EIIBC or EIIC component